MEKKLLSPERKAELIREVQAYNKRRSDRTAWEESLPKTQSDYSIDTVKLLDLFTNLEELLFKPEGEVEFMLKSVFTSYLEHDPYVKMNPLEQSIKAFKIHADIMALLICIHDNKDLIMRKVDEYSTRSEELGALRERDFKEATEFNLNPTTTLKAAI